MVWVMYTVETAPLASTMVVGTTVALGVMVTVVVVPDAATSATTCFVVCSSMALLIASWSSLPRSTRFCSSNVSLWFEQESGGEQINTPAGMTFFSCSCSMALTVPFCRFFLVGLTFGTWRMGAGCDHGSDQLLPLAPPLVLSLLEAEMPVLMLLLPSQ